MTVKLLKRQRGLSLIEVLISLMVLGVALLGLGGLQIAAVKGSTNAHLITTASMLAMDFSDRMRANLDGVEAGYYAENIACNEPVSICRFSGSNCTVQELSKYDIQEIKCGTKIGTKREGGVVNLLPNGSFDVTCNNPGGCLAPKAVHTVTITWNEQSIEDNQTAIDHEKTFVVPVIP